MSVSEQNTEICSDASSNWSHGRFYWNEWHDEYESAVRTFACCGADNAQNVTRLRA
jgi:hypothetical protein